MTKCALVTGAARGIGAAIAQRLRDDGWAVHAVDLEDGDLSTREGNRAVVDAALERFDGRLDAVVANAGFQHVASVRDFPEDRWDTLQAPLVTSPFLLAKYAWDALAASGDGRFLAVASVGGWFVFSTLHQTKPSTLASADIRGTREPLAEKNKQAAPPTPTVMPAEPAARAEDRPP